MKCFAVFAFTLALAGCDSGKTEASGPKKPEPPNPAGKWEMRSNPGETYLFTRYEFKSDQSFTRETGTGPKGVITGKISGSWRTSSQEAPRYSIAETLTDKMLRGAGIEAKDGSSGFGSIVLSYNVESKNEIGVGATLVAERGPVLEPEKRTYTLEEHYSLSLKKSDDKEWLIIGLQRFEKVSP